jgi:3-methyladenine DNA glycosylase AlkC
LLATADELTLGERLVLIRPLADDEHFGVREWAWLALRPRLTGELEATLFQLHEWVHAESENLRRFAIEVTRPRGVWCAHWPALQEKPQRALPLLEALRNDPSRYVQNSVANWLNDASRTQPRWVEQLCAHWLRESPTRNTGYICRRAQRNLR